MLENLSLKNTPKSDHKSSTEIELALLESNLRTVQLALEILTGACATLPDPEPDAPENEDDNNDEGTRGLWFFPSLCFDFILWLGLEFERQDDVDVDMSTQMDTDSPESSNTSLLTTLVTPLLTLIQPTALSFPPLASPSPHPPTTSALSALHISALECLNNVFLSLTTSKSLSISSDANSGRTVWDGIWSALSLIGTQTGLGQERRQEAWNIAVGVLWGVGRIWKGSIVSLPPFSMAF